jgi:CarD family transcriptional regulator
MAQKKKTAVKAKAAKVVAQPKKSVQAAGAARGAATAPRKPAPAPVAAKPAVPAAGASKDKKIASAPVAKVAAAVKAPAAKPAVGKAAAPVVKAAAPIAGAKKPAVAPVPARSQQQASKVAQAFAAHRAQAASQPAAPPRATPAAPPRATVAATAAARPAGPARSAPAVAAKTTAGSKITAPAKAAEVLTSPKAIAEKAAAARQLLAAQKKPVHQRHGFKTNEFIVYPAHGVGRIVGIEEQEIAGMSLELFVINFEKEKLTLRVPTGKLESVGMRKLADDDIVKRAMEILKGRARIKRTMWSRRAQEYVAKINSGDLISIAEVVRDLYRSEAQPEQSYSERQLYEDALDRMAREIAAVEKLDDRGAVQRITEVLSKSARGRRIAEDGGEPEEVQAA